MRRFLLSVFFTAGITASFNASADCSAKSGKHVVPLLELYTSEGCSSCPPADSWMSSITKTGHSPGRIVPLAFHVDYWDYIGWKDHFAKPEFSLRQRHSAAMAGASFVYTPQFILNGNDFRSWHQQGRLVKEIAFAQKQVAKADLSIDLATTVPGELKVKATAGIKHIEDSNDADMFIAVYENKLTSIVKAGENDGRKLQHDYVVREWFGPYRLEGESGAVKHITLNPEWKGRDAGVASFIQNRQNGEILQALSLPFCST